MTRFLAAALLSIAALGAAAPSHAEAAPPKIAVVDLQRAINETEDGRKAKERLQSLFAKRQEGLDQKQKELKSLKEQIDKQQSVLSREALQKKVESYQQSLAELQQVYMEYQRELAAKEGELTQKIIERMERILRRMGQSQGYTLILERSEAGVVWVPSNLDLTDELIQKYNAGEGRDAQKKK